MQVAIAAVEGDKTLDELAQHMDGKGCWRDNVFVKQLWKSVKYEEV